MAKFVVGSFFEVAVCGVGCFRWQCVMYFFRWQRELLDLLSGYVFVGSFRWQRELFSLSGGKVSCCMF